MKTVQQVITSTWKGSPKTYEMVKEQIRERWGDADAEAFDPKTDALTLPKWAFFGYRVKQGEHALKSITFIEDETENGPVQKIRRSVNLFYKKQVQKQEVKAK